MKSSLLLALLTVGCSRWVISSTTPSQKLLVILLDGFRWDYVQNMNLTNFNRLKNIGANSGFLTPDFPTLSYPNYYSLMTGLHTESHGMTSNFMFSDSERDYFLLGTNPESNHSHWWAGAEPLWVTVVKEGKRACTYNWPGSETIIGGQTPTMAFFTNYSKLAGGLQHSLVAAVMHLTTPQPIDLAAVYIGQPDEAAHTYGLGSAQLAEILADIDSSLGWLLDILQHNSSAQQVNLIVVSDHGMTSVDPSQTINITTVLTNRDHYLTIMEAGSLAIIHTAEGYRDQVYELLRNFSPHMTVYKKEDIPERFHFKSGKYVGDILCLADIGWIIAQPLYPDFVNTAGQNMRAYHGYDNLQPDMRGIFFAYGPYFKRNVTVPSVAIVDIYNIMCNILGINAKPNNGSWSVVSPLVSA